MIKTVFKKQLAVSIALVFLVSFAACATFSKDSYRALSVSAETYNATMGALGDLYKQGRISEEAKAKAVELGTCYEAAYNAAIDANQAYLRVESDQNRDKVTAALIEYSRVLGEVLNYTNAAIAKANK